MHVLLVCAALLLCCSFFRSVESEATSELTAVQEAFFRWHLQQAPEFSTQLDTRTFNDRLTDLSIEAMDTQLADVERFIQAASTIGRDQLTAQHQYSYDVFMDTLTTFAANYDWRLYGALNPISFLEGFYLNLDDVVAVTPFDTKADFDNFLSRLEAWPTQVDQMMVRMEEAIRVGTTYHRVSVRAVPDQISAVISTPPELSPLYTPFSHTLGALPGISRAQREGMTSRALSALSSLWSALRRLRDFVQHTYSLHTRVTHGVWGLPAGKGYYRACLQWYLSLDLSPQHVHRTGLREVDRIAQLMRQVMTRQGFHGSVSQYYNQLKADPQFHLNSQDQVIEAYKALIFNRITPKLPQLFKNIPPRKVVVKPLPFDGPFGMYSGGSADGSRPGVFYVNLHRPNESNTFSMVSLALHETVPGHHLHNSYRGASDLPSFLKHVEYDRYYAVPYHFQFYSAQNEGWALYAEYLGEEMGVYANDYEMMGRYGNEMLRACRLVVDTGMHYFGWSREKAIRFLSERTPMFRAEVEIEVDRYLTWPGQACAYKIGELKIKELRCRAATALGTRFDLRDFHSLLLNNVLPLRVMETIVNDYIANHTGGPLVGRV
ncbi:uncharacterized protein LOC143282098 [Babylonia areolata]|uniref:uncharacterized protein LOC143282098 n=1 Tax=Babylonia areolata TaxID=304850 RepID=UPI003FD50F11